MFLTRCAMPATARPVKASWRCSCLTSVTSVKTSITEAISPSSSKTGRVCTTTSIRRRSRVIRVSSLEWICPSAKVWSTRQLAHLALRFLQIS